MIKIIEKNPEKVRDKSRTFPGYIFNGIRRILLISGHTDKKIHFINKDFTEKNPEKVRDKQDGLVVLMMVLIISAVILAMIVSIALASIDEINMTDFRNHSQETLAITDGCLEEALLSLNRDPEYSGTNLNLGQGSCIIGVTENGGLYTILVTANLDNYIRKIQAGVILDPSFTLISRTEITN